MRIFSQSSEYAFEAAVNSIGDMVPPCRIALLMLLCCFLCGCGLSTGSWCRFPSGVRCAHLLSPVIAKGGRLFRSRRMRCRLGYYIICASLFTTWMWSVVEYLLLNLALVAGWCRVSFSRFFVSIFVSTFRCLIVDVSVCNS